MQNMFLIRNSFLIWEICKIICFAWKIKKNNWFCCSGWNWYFWPNRINYQFKNTVCFPAMIKSFLNFSRKQVMVSYIKYSFHTSLNADWQRKATWMRINHQIHMYNLDRLWRTVLHTAKRTRSWRYINTQVSQRMTNIP